MEDPYMFSTRNNLFVLLAVALMGFSISLMSSQQDTPRDNRWLKSLRGPLPTVSDAERKDGAQQAEAQKASWFAVSHNINVDKDAIGKVQAAFEELKALAARLVRQNAIRTLLRDTQGKLASIISTAEGQSTSINALFAPRNTEQTAKEQKQAAETALVDNSLTYFRSAKDQFI